MKNTNIFIVFKLNGTWKNFWRCDAYVWYYIFVCVFFLSVWGGFFHFLWVYMCVCVCWLGDVMSVRWRFGAHLLTVCADQWQRFILFICVVRVCVSVLKMLGTQYTHYT